MKPILHGAAVLCACVGAFAQTPQLQEITVTGNPLGATNSVAPTSIYTRDKLTFRSKTTLGETLSGTPGVSSSYFGPNASRPIIRGQDGDRIRVLANGGAALDASSLSFDHAVTLDPLSTERIEVLRGPGALLYGGSAVGGVVNVIDNRIARQAQFDENGGVSGKFDLSAASGNRENAAGVLLETGTNRFSLHFDGFNRKTGDVKVPRTLACTKPGSPASASRICNSASQTHGAAVGGSIFFDQGYVGASVAHHQTNYGTVAEDQVNIGMKSTRYNLQGELRNMSALLQTIKGSYSASNYAHSEFDAGVLGTTFKNKGYEARLEARHAKVGNLDGSVGLQSEVSHFSAVGDEAFAPFSRSANHAVFAYEELAIGWGKLTAGARFENATVQSYGNPLVPRFTPATRSFKPASFAFGAMWNAAPRWQLTTNLTQTERAPKDYELFANGPHVATAAYEIGNTNLTKERSSNLDIGAAWKEGAHRFSINAYVSQFKNYIGLIQTSGVTRNKADGERNPVEDPANAGFSLATGETFDPLSEFVYQAVKARFVGFELGGRIQLKRGLDLELRADVVRATNQTSGLPLPRIAPMRTGATLQWSQGPAGADIGFDHYSAQTRVAPGQRPAEAYTLWNAGANYRFGDALLYARLDNITNELAYSASSVLTTTAFPKAPLPGRSLKLGVQLGF